MSEKKREVWQRGPVEGVPPLLQPVAHALLQAGEEVKALTVEFQQELLWQRPAEVASVGFHLQHLSGVIDRLFTYAKGGALSNEQLERLQAETSENNELTLEALIETLEQQIAAALNQLKDTDQDSLTEERFLGRAKIPTTVIGLLFHAAEHTMRHVGQLLVTVRMLKSGLQAESSTSYTQGH